MKKKVKTILFVFIVIGVVILNITYKNKNEVIKTKRKRQGNLAIMVKGESGEYISSDAIPKGNYVLNEEKTICENGGKVVSYNNSTGQIGFSFLGSDRCSLYFDKIIDTENPVITNLNINGTTVTATLTDNLKLSSYGISTSNSVEPSSWTSISGTSYNLSTSITTEGTYYLWVKDSSNNKVVSGMINIKIYGWNTILLNSTLNETTPDFSKTATTNEGLFKAHDDLGTSYYFRGAVNNNWVKFGKYSSNGPVRGYYSSTSSSYKEYNSLEECNSASKYNYNCSYAWNENDDIYWRIIRINGDGSIRMIYSGTTRPDSGTATVMTGTGTQISAGAFNSSDDNAEYVGYQYIKGQQQGYGECNGTSASCTVNGKTVYNSAIKQAIDKWYAGTTLKDNALISQDQIFCNDRSASTSYSNTNYTTLTSWNSTGTQYYYGAYGRLKVNKMPILTCPTASDKFTVNTSNGNGALTYPVGLITADEVAMAGGVYETSNSSYYLYTNQFHWLGSPNHFNRGGSPNVFSVYTSGDLSSRNVLTPNGARPVVSLSSKVKLSGSGTYNDVYTVN